MGPEPARNPVRIAFVGGGSGGHLVPAIAIAEALSGRAPGCELLFLISHRPIDRRILNTRGWPSAGVRVEPYVRQDTRFRFTGPLRYLPAVLRGFQRAKRLFREFRPDVAVGLGAFASVPGILAASRLGIPVVLLEHNVIPGRATRMLARHARLTLAGWPFDATMAANWPCPLIQTGVPVRPVRTTGGPDIGAPRTDSHRISGTDAMTDAGCGVSQSEPGTSAVRSRPASSGTTPRLLILGGSQGASRLNRLVLESLASDPGLLHHWNIVHQTGEADLEFVRDAYIRQGRTARSTAFLDELPDEMARADIVISRAGAVTLQELAGAGRAAILVPLSTARDQHQLANARLLTDAGGALLIRERDDGAARQLHDLLRQIASDPDLRNRMGRALQALARPDAAARAAEYILSTARGTGDI